MLILIAIDTYRNTFTSQLKWMVLSMFHDVFLQQI